MKDLKMRELGQGYTVEVDACDDGTWSRILEEFDDASIYQTWSYAAVIAGRRKTSHLILRKNGDIVAIAQARIAKLPFINAGIAYIHWGPLWRRRATGMDVDIFRQVLRALRNEFAYRRGLVLRVFPILFDNDPPILSEILTEEGFSSVGSIARGRTILMDLNPTLDEL